jgi:hypothetical protein
MNEMQQASVGVGRNEGDKMMNIRGSMDSNSKHQNMPLQVTVAVNQSNMTPLS